MSGDLRERLSAYLDRWRAGGGDEQSTPSVRDLLAGLWPNLDWKAGDPGSYAEGCIYALRRPRYAAQIMRIPGCGWIWSATARWQGGDVRDWDQARPMPLLDALCALSAAGVPMPGAGETDPTATMLPPPVTGWVPEHEHLELREDCSALRARVAELTVALANAEAAAPPPTGPCGQPCAEMAEYGAQVARCPCCGESYTVDQGVAFAAESAGDPEPHEGETWATVVHGLERALAERTAEREAARRRTRGLAEAIAGLPEDAPAPGAGEGETAPGAGGEGRQG